MMKAALETIHETRHETFAFREFDQARFTSPWHYHPEFEITLIESSVGELFVGDRIRPFDSGEVYVFGCSLPHYFHNSEGRSKRNRARAVVVQFLPDVFGRDFWGLSEMGAVRRFMTRARAGFQVKGVALASTVARMRRMRRQSGAERLFELFHLLDELSRAEDGLVGLSSEGFMPTLDPEASQRMTRIYQYIFRELASDISLGEAARAAGMTESAFCRYFRRMTGKRFTDFINELRVSRSCRDLIETSSTVAEIAFACGYGSISNYNRCFRQITGVSPREFRARHRAG
ncbi:helix-turn-helix transcriptional regulator [Ruficoccus amylovorans]|uniref:Helix-turn-helix transcriptional regulator n=1 Tax=Ruficoccus amylovorans TaxID=1804625 RepID=A0A842HBM4_9BACT|nr:AraC family transcriptional regulator [Ruficoccus amylovorans]MBC2593468.1 helix-turn-helix transcriptional regulator [Ruficoccus amylovorans]